MKESTSKSAVSTELASSRRRWPMMAGAIIVGSFYLAAAFADFLSPYDYRSLSRREPLAPPSALHFRDAEGRWHARPFVYAQRLVDSLERRYEEDRQRAYPLELFALGYSYKLFGLFAANRHLFGVRGAEAGGTPRVFLLGTDALGRDRLSRLLVASRFSLLVGPMGTLLAALLGVAIGCCAGYAGRFFDIVLMRAADVMMALPALVMILAARAAFPLELPTARAATLLICLFVALGWAEMARLTRGLVLELRARAFVTAAVSIGMSPLRVLLRHILPNAARPLIVQTLLMLPAFLL
jgi:peptide/nickel transport system permease protein